MTAGSNFPGLLSNADTAPANLALSLGPDGLAAQPRMFKKHKVLPRPRRDDGPRYGVGNAAVLVQNDSPLTSAKPGRSPATRPARGPEPPPTPPAHSRNPSTDHPSDISPPRHPGTRPSTSDSDSYPPVTPLHHQSPPTPNLTPDRTPPGQATGQTPRRPPTASRNASKMTTDSKAESFQTARESPSGSSDSDSDAKPTLRLDSQSAKAPQAAARQFPGETTSVPQPVGLGLQLGPSPFDDGPAKRPQLSVRGDTAHGKAPVKAAEWDSDRMKNVTLRKHAGDGETVGDRPVTPTNATRAMWRIPVEESPIVYSARRIASDRFPTRRTPNNSETSVDARRSSVASTRSNASTVVGATVMLETGAPQRQRTLRHVRKQSALRDSGSDISSAPAPASGTPAADVVQQRRDPPASRTDEGVRDSIVSVATSNSISSRKARRSVRKNGGVPVVVIPERRSSIKSNSRPSSPQSASSRRSLSVRSVATSEESKSREPVPRFERLPQRSRSRAYSESDGPRPGDERTMDFPPVIPIRSSSLSAPTSRNASRRGSLTAESLRAHNLLQAQQAHQALVKASEELDTLYQQPGLGEPGQEESRLKPGAELSGNAKSIQATVRPNRGRDTLGEHGTRADGDEDRRTHLSVQNTPLSVVSVETTATSHAEVSEATAINIYSHQSKCVALIDHPAKPSETPSLELGRFPALAIPAPEPASSVKVPATPPQNFSIDNIDSPLRNPRAPPKPPAINFIPATPSGLTPTIERKKQVGNYFEITAEKPKMSLSLLRRALTSRSARDLSPPRFLSRRFSLSQSRSKQPQLRRRSSVDSPADESRLHPYWRPAYTDDEHCCCCSGCTDDECILDQDHGRPSNDQDRTYRYPPIDNRPAPPRRRLSERIKKTFAILPTRDDDFEDFPATSDDGPDRRTIRRTPSGNLRVMKRRQSMESLTRPADSQPYSTPPITQVGRGPARVWRSLSLKARSSLRRTKSEPTQSSSSTKTTTTTTAEAGREERKGDDAAAGTVGFRAAFSDKINLPRRVSERRRERRTQELRGKISGPKEVRDGVRDVVRPKSWQRPVEQQQQQQQQQQWQEAVDPRLGGGTGTPDADALYVWEQQRERQRFRKMRVQA
ncbi:hypothetical protein VTJ83DRAFT_7263 [Remersonia thermophila]|uniref:Uncharacterized protein n=1 Tax=Remersonia thermophila TaxID=72144 RepID=A0ABR4D344_9PEZI